MAAHLTELGVPAEADGRRHVGAGGRAPAAASGSATGARVVLLGGAGLEAALLEAGLVPVGAEDDAVAVVSGYGPEVLWRDIMRVAVRVRDGLPWVASNADLTIPTAFGVAPGHGVLVETLATVRRRRRRSWPASRSDRCSTRPCGGWWATGR